MSSVKLTYCKLISMPFFDSKRHSEMGVHSIGSIPRQELLDHHFTLGRPHRGSSAFHHRKHGAGRNGYNITDF